MIRGLKITVKNFKTTFVRVSKLFIPKRAVMLYVNGNVIPIYGICMKKKSLSVLEN
jgi:hypothetical protein